MEESVDVSQISTPAASDSVTAALLEIAGDLDKAQLLQSTVPAWLIAATAQTRQALHDTYAGSEHVRGNAVRLLARVVPLKQFCSERLRALLTAKGHADLDVERDVLEIPRVIVTSGRLIPEATPKTVSVDQHSLLQAAMQNFTEDRAAPRGLPPEALIRLSADGAVYHSLNARTFVGYCRELDVGEAYQQHLREVFNLPQPDEVVDLDRGYNPAVNDIGQAKSVDLQIDLHIAYAKGDVGQAAYEVLLALIKADGAASTLKDLRLNNLPLIWHGLRIHGANLWSVLVFSHAMATGASDGPLLVYMPGEPVRPWYEYPSLAAFKTYLSLKLQVVSYRDFFSRYLDESERKDFFQRFDLHKTLDHVEPMPVVAYLSWFFFLVVTCKLQTDARVLAVPKALVDETEQQQRLGDYLEAGLNLLNLAALVVPVLGQLMMGVAIGEVLAEVYDGVEDWSHGDKSEALEHMVNVAESLAGMALFALGVKTVIRVFKTTKVPPAQFFDKMEAVRLPDGAPRLWRPRLEPYRQPVEMDALSSANSQGISQLDGQSYVQVDGALYSIVFDLNMDCWRVRHPLRATGYRPPLRHNRQDSWRFMFEHPDDWQSARYVLTRLDPSLASIGEEHLNGITAISDLKLPRLHFLFRESLPLPERFRDNVVRARLNQKVRDLAWQLEHQAHPDADTWHAQLLALTLMPGWPKGRFFAVLDSEGVLLKRYPNTSPFVYEDLSIRITEQQLEDGEVMSTLLAQFEPDDVRALLGAEVAPAQRHALLARQLLVSLKRTHRQVYEQMYQQTEHAGHTHSADVGLFKAHHPRLPHRVAQELLLETPNLHLWQLRDNRRVPLLLAQRARTALQTLEEDDALMGLLFAELATEDTERLVIGLLARVRGWPSDTALQLREGSLTGRLLARSGGEVASVQRIVVKSAQGFQAFDAQGNALGEIAGDKEGLYQALLDALSRTQRMGMGISQEGDGGRLRYLLRDEAEAGRLDISRYLRLRQEQPVPEAQGLCLIDAQLAPDQQHPNALVSKVRKLYPLLTDRQIAAFIDQQGVDHLSRAQAIQVLEREFEGLHRALSVWRKDEASLIGLPKPLRDYQLGRVQAMARIESCWRKMVVQPDATGTKVQTLDLRGVQVGALPTLPAEVSFPATRQVLLSHMQLNDDMAYFLKHFKAVHTLDMQGNQMTRLPEVLSQMPELKRLCLNDNRLQLTDYTRSKLASMTDLESLNLNNNPLQDPPLLNKMFGLRELFLRNCRLKELPGGMQRLPYLEYLDLRDNDITALPQWIADLPRNLAQTLNLRQNPLDSPSRFLLSGYRRRTGIGMGFLEDDIARLNEQKARELWLQDDSSIFPARQTTWAGLNDERGSDGLFHLLAELGNTADATNVREDLSLRVWRVLEAAEMDADLRAEIFERAATPLNCDDAAAVSFANLEVLTEVNEASKGIEGGVLTAKPLLRLGKGLFRLDRLEHYAQQHIIENPSVDPLEVSLAFRTGLADRFYLPGQPRHMRYARLGGVTAQDMTTAAGQLLTAELSPELLDYLVELPLWIRFLKKTYGVELERLNQPFEQRMQSVFDQGLTLSDKDYRDQMDKILREQAQAESTELKRQTQAQLRLDELNICQP